MHMLGALILIFVGVFLFLYGFEKGMNKLIEKVGPKPVGVVCMVLLVLMVIVLIAVSAFEGHL